MLLRALVLLLCSASVALSSETVLVPTGSTWRYLDDGSNQFFAWRLAGYNDSGWATGAAQLGYGDGDEATVVGFGTDAADKYETTWFRKTFEVIDPSAFSSLELRLLVDDGAVVFLNGVEVARDNMGTGLIQFSALAGSTISGLEEDLFYPHPVSSSVLVAGTNVLAIEVHQDEVDSSDLSMEAELIGYDQLTMLRGPYLQRITPNEVTVRWRTDVPSPSQLVYGVGTLGTSIDESTLVTEHEVRVTGLSPDTTYDYGVGDGAGLFVGGDANYRFTTAPSVGEDRPFRAWVLGDSGTADVNAESVRDAYLGFTGSLATDLVLMLGDNAYVKGADYEYQAAVFDIYGDVLRRSPLYSTRGNHDDDAGVYYGTFSFPSAGEGGGVPSGSEAYYSFDWANVHFICLDSEGSNKSPTGPMATWLQADLASTSQDWIVAFWHHAPYTKGSHNSDSESGLITMRKNFVPLLEAGGVDLVLCGHSHSYERSHLIDGHHGGSLTFDPDTHLKDPGTGNPTTDGAYFKAVMPNAGTVYAVAGSSGKTSGGTLNHPAMVVSTKTLGSVVIDVDGERMDVSFVSGTGAVLDSFTLRTYPDLGLTADTTTLSLVTGGTQSFAIDAGASHAGELYLFLGSLSGDAPGVAVGAYNLPLNVDNYLNRTLLEPNTAVHQATFGLLDTAGQAAPKLFIPAGLSPALVGLTAHHAALSVDPLTGSFLFTTGAFPTTFLP